MDIFGSKIHRISKKSFGSKLKISHFIRMDYVIVLLRPYQMVHTVWNIMLHTLYHM